jgi:secreted trypsin-like serine protease
MNYSVNNYPPVLASPPLKANRTKFIICAVICVVILLAIVVIGLGLGLGFGLGLGLRNKSSDSSVLSAPTVSCTYVSSSTCGCAATKPSFISSKIINGYSAVSNSWPWIVILYYNNSQRCDGFLVTYQHVVTAAHCVYGLSTSLLQVYAGVYSLTSSPNKQIRNVSQIEIHFDYSSTTFVNDIAIVKLSSILSTNTNVGICCLPSDISLPTVNQHAVIIGWGTTSATSINIPDTLQQAVVEIKSAASCDITSNSNSQFCAGYGTTDTCQGDSGGPLMTDVNNAWTCTGIVSYGRGCIGAGYYTRVSYYRSFIDNAISNL